jgi:sigma-54 dependent transcriptional regulator, acetoin dehydrogenase operon transcriptional activator AcoR
MSEGSAAWKRIVEELKAGSALLQEPSVQPLILDSWRRCRDAGVKPDGPVLLLSVDEADLSRRRLHHRVLLEAAVGAIDKFSRSLGKVKHVVYMTDSDGIVLYSKGTDNIMRAYGLRPGFDWSEQAMGTNGAGTALACNAPVAVIGPEHWTLPFHDASCFASPIRDERGNAVAAVDLSTHINDGDAAHLTQIVDLAREIEDTWRCRRQQSVARP